ncbi:serine hydrolase domain-containing protein [Gordonia rhizosphera]|uniref:Peptidase S12 family protein n=1 Tax=Gordonia rhizosphera NBRC 16068 TaxID=1108045 RepID=K6WCX9_9ACTN|nr:serine hydrolase domain-containing protein [Gordonia rhizosphera]GAB90047.1 peptidase S12 family protein [Gordonia rhizosphera NBRC 16068]
MRPSGLNARSGLLTMMTMVAATILLFAACGSSDISVDTPSGTSSSSPASAAVYQNVLDDVRAAGGFPGVIARIVSPEGTWTGTSGTAGADRTAAPTSTDRTRIGSLTKTMTATILLQLVQEKRLSLDDTIGTYVSGVPNGDTATLRQLADMTSGIPSYTESNAVADKYFANPEYAWPPAELVDAVKPMPADFAPGQGWEYSNTNYILLGMVIEKVLHQPIAETFATRLFTPLDMSDTTFPGGSVEIAAPHLDGQTDQGQPAGHNVDSTHWNPSFAFTAGAVISTLDDLQKWGDALFTGNGILEPATQQLRRDSILHSPPPNTATAGYGIGIGDRDGWWGHDGDIPGYNSVLFRNYGKDTTILVLTNSDNTVTIDGHEQAPAQAVFAGLVAALPR